MLALAMPFALGKIVNFEPIDGCIFERIENGISVTCGNCHIINGHCIALYGYCGKIYFQVDQKRWPLDCQNLKLHYSHDITSKMTTFKAVDELGEVVITYPAWWSGLGAGPFLMPEMDEDRDYLAYIHSVWNNNYLQTQLLKAWT